MKWSAFISAEIFTNMQWVLVKDCLVVERIPSMMQLLLFVFLSVTFVAVSTYFSIPHYNCSKTNLFSPLLDFLRRGLYGAGLFVNDISRLGMF
jgi:hypothetical protein